MRLALAIVTQLSLVLAAENGTYSLLHRFLPHSSQSEPEFSKYGVVSLDHSALVPTGSFALASDRQPQSDDGTGWYQIALDVDGQLLTSSIKSCYTAAPQIYTLTIHTLSDSKPSSISLELPGGIPPNGKCPKWYQKGEKLPLPNGINTAVVVGTPVRAQKVEIAPPPSVDPNTGKPAEKDVEKTFIQKYWLALLGLALFVIPLLGPEPEGRGGGGGGGR